MKLRIGAGPIIDVGEIADPRPGVGVIVRDRHYDFQIQSRSAILLKSAQYGLADLFRTTIGNTSAALTERTIAIWKLMRASVADAGPDLRCGRLTPETNSVNKSNKIVDVLIDFRNAVGIPRRDARFILAFCDRYCLFDGQQNHASLTT